MTLETQTETPFAAVHGQLKVRDAFRRILRQDRLSHAYLFVGPVGTGRSAMAIELARVLSCKLGASDSAEVDCDCASCRSMRRWQHPNLLPIFPLPPTDKDNGAAAQAAFEEFTIAKARDVYAPLSLSGSGLILVEQIRELRNRLSLTASQKGTRTVIIYPADALPPASANSLLKILEEPPADCCFILIISNLRAVPSTIVSRCQVIRFAPLGRSEVFRALASRGIPTDSADLAARLCDGSLTRALQLVGEDAAKSLNWGLEFLRAGAVGNAEQINRLIDDIGENSRQRASEYLEWTAVWLRAAIRIQLNNSPSDDAALLSEEQTKVAAKIASRYRLPQLTASLSAIEETRLAVSSNALIGLAFVALSISLKRQFS